MIKLYVDADACPVKAEVERVADRHGLRTFMVSDGGIRPSFNPLIEVVTVASGSDAADDWIADNISTDDICITNDIPLAARCLKKNAHALRPNGEPILFVKQDEGRKEAGSGRPSLRTRAPGRKLRSSSRS